MACTTSSRSSPRCGRPRPSPTIRAFATGTSTAARRGRLHHLYEYSYKNDIRLKLPTNLTKREVRILKKLRLSKNDSDSWWIGYYAPATNSEYVVSAEPLLTYRVVEKRTWYSWFRQKEQTVYLLKKRT